MTPTPTTSDPAPFRFDVESLFARAGGGGSFHGSGGGHSSGGSRSSGGSHSYGGGYSSGGRGGISYGGGGGGTVAGPEVLFFVAVIVIIILFFAIKAIRDAAEETHGGYRVRPAIPPPYDAVAALHRSDPTFNAAAFYHRVQTAFLSLQDAWSAQNLDHVRPFISDAILERFTLQFGEQKFLGYRNVLSDVRVHDIRLAQALSDHLYDTAIVRITASANDRNVNLDGSICRGDPGTRAPFVEYWSFLRKRGAHSVQRGLIEGNCPNCGAAVNINQNVNCQHCQASLRGAQYDWVLTEITQESEWRPTRNADIPGLAQMVQRDRNFTPADLEDRASVMFWRLSLADRTASINPLRKMATPIFLQDYAALLKGRDEPERRIYLDAGVGSVTTRALTRIADDAGDSTDYALIEICWSAIVYCLTPNAKPQRTTEDDLHYTWYVLERNGNTLTDPSTTISSAHCPNCGAALSDDASNGCNYCNTPLTDGTHGWLLTQLTPRNETSVLNLFNLPMRG